MLISKWLERPLKQLLIFEGSSCLPLDHYRFGGKHPHIRFEAVSGKHNLATGDTFNSSKEKLLKKKIMIVDDESQIAKLYSLILSNAGFTVSHLEFDGTYALSRLQNGADIDLVIMDQMMPSMDGTTATKSIKPIKPDLTVVMVSVYEIPDNEKKMFDAVLTKPVSSKTFVDTVDAVLGAYPAPSN